MCTDLEIVKVEYRPNRTNTVAIVLFAIPTFTALYLKLWYPQLRTDTVTVSTDTVV